MTMTDRPAPPAAAPPRPSRRRGILVTVAVLLMLVASGTWFVVTRNSGQRPVAPSQAAWRPLPGQKLPATDDALQRRSLAELANFTDWLARNGARGYIGEVGLPGGPDVDRWMVLGQRWFTAAKKAGLWVDVWGAGEWWGQDYAYSPFVSGDDGAISITRKQGELLSWASRNTDLKLGVDLSGGEFGAPGGSDKTADFSNRNPGTYDHDWHYDSQQSLNYLASRGVNTIRLPFRWERIQPQLGGPLDPDELARLQDVVARANSAGLGVILDVHNFAAYFTSDGKQGVRRGIGSPELSNADFADLWSRLSAAFQGRPGVLAYDLMNEPVYLAGDERMDPSVDRSGARAWESASQAAVDAIRSRGDGTLVMVPSYGYSHAGEWAQMHPRPWITDPTGNVRYTAHAYWSQDEGKSYRADLKEAVGEGY